MLTVYIGYDPREEQAYRVAAASLRRRASIPVTVHPLRLDRLEAAGLYRRPYGWSGGVMWDYTSQAPCSTEFAISRFLVPIIHQSGPALFVDCDVVFLGDVAELLALADPRYAVQVVQHQYAPAESTKMDGQPQTTYARKNWSSVMLFNTDHQANRRLRLHEINNAQGLWLHQFGWLRDAEIGALPPEWNWLVGVQPRPPSPRLAHLTLGGPWLQGWQPREHDEIWIDALEDARWKPASCANA